MSRSRATARSAGTRWETTIVRALIARGWVNAERRRLGGRSDRGDIAGLPGWVIEAKDTPARIDLAGAVDEATVEAANAGTPYGVAWIKRKGRPSAEDGYVVMTGDVFMQLLKEAGW